MIDRVQSVCPGQHSFSTLFAELQMVDAASLLSHIQCDSFGRLALMYDTATDALLDTRGTTRLFSRQPSFFFTSNVMVDVMDTLQLQHRWTPTGEILADCTQPQSFLQLARRGTELLIMAPQEGLLDILLPLAVCSGLSTVCCLVPAAYVSTGSSSDMQIQDHPRSNFLSWLRTHFSVSTIDISQSGSPTGRAWLVIQHVPVRFSTSLLHSDDASTRVGGNAQP